jgi:metal-sulfur cluster biosynthetic enzyme
MSAPEIARALGTVYDPELGIDIVSLGLLYGIDEEPGEVHVTMTTTFEGCPMGAAIEDSVRRTVAMACPGQRVGVEVTHEPPWDVAMLTPEARRRLGLN